MDGWVPSRLQGSYLRPVVCASHRLVGDAGISQHTAWFPASSPTRMPTIHKLKAMDDFRCIGPDCPASCCADAWNIDVDADTLARWRAEPDESSRTWLLSALDTAAPPGRVLLRHTLPHNHCVQLSNDKLCAIQTRHGHEYLPAGCRLYPRIHPT